MHMHAHTQAHTHAHTRTHTHMCEQRGRRCELTGQQRAIRGVYTTALRPSLQSTLSGASKRVVTCSLSNAAPRALALLSSNDALFCGSNSIRTHPPSLGDFGYKRWGKASLAEQLVTCKPEILVYPTDATDDADEFLLIACDGVWDVMSSQDAVDFIHKQLDEGGDAVTLGVALENMLDKCLELGSLDNMTAAIIAFPGICRQHKYFRPKSSGICAIS